MYSKDIENVLINHSKLYPLMDIQDLVKLIYQFSLGPNHFINQDLNKVKEQIIIEGKNNKSLNKEIIYIGNDLYRVTLINDLNYLNKVFECFIKTLNDYINNKENDLINNIKESVNYLSYFKNINKEKYINYINEYLKNGLLPVSHSKTFKDAYHPSYRLVHKKYISLLKEE